MLNIVLFGPPGAGKGTQSEKILKKYNLEHLSTGDLLRAEIKEGSKLGLSAKNFIDNGLLVPDDVVIAMIGNKIKHNQDIKGFIFDGFPRTVAQARSLDQLCTLYNISINCMLSLKVEDEELKKRLSIRGKTSGRSDDQDPELIEERIAEYKRKTAPVAKYYADQDKYHEVDGMQHVDEVFDDLSSIIDRL